MHKISLNIARAYQGFTRYVYTRGSKLPMFRDIKVLPSTDTSRLLNSFLCVKNDTQRLSLRDDFPTVYSSIKEQVEDLGHIGRTRRAEFPNNTPSVDYQFRKHPVVRRIVDMALKAHETELSGHDSPHIRAVVNRAVNFAEHYNKTEGHKRIDMPLLIVCAAVHDLGQTIPGIGRKLHSTEMAGDKILEILGSWNDEFASKYPGARHLSENDLLTVWSCVTQHSLGGGKEEDQIRISTITNPIVKIVTLADKSCGGGMLGAARCVLFSVRNNAPILDAHKQNGDPYPSSEAYIKNVLLKYIDHVKSWEEYKAVSRIIERQSNGMHRFIEQLKDESIIPEKISKSLDPVDLAGLENVAENIIAILKSKYQINEIIHPNRVMITSLEIAYKHLKWHPWSLNKHDLLILALSALLHNFWKPESGAWASSALAIRGMVHFLSNAGLEKEDIASILQLIDYKQLCVSKEPKSILSGSKIADSLPLFEIDFEKNKKMRLMTDILADAETISKNFGAHGVVYNIYESNNDDSDNDTILSNYLRRMLEWFADLKPIKLRESVIIARPLMSFNLEFLYSARQEIKCDFD